MLASAAYNAGPVARAALARRASRSKARSTSRPIPFAETRDYVKKVMANSVFYAAVLEQKPVPLKARLGVIPPPGGVEPPVEDELR